MKTPGYLQIEPVGQCNLRCQMCPIQFRRDGPPHGPPAFMAYDTFLRLLDGFEGLETLHLQGLGEPLMHPRFFDMVREAASRGARVTTNSNLTLLNQRRAEALVLSGLDCLHVSLDGAKAQTYESIRRRARFSRVIENVRLVTEARRRLGSDRPRLHVVMVLMRQNLEELPALVRLAASLEADELFVQRLCHDFTEDSLPAVYAPMRHFVSEQDLDGIDSAVVERCFDEARRMAEECGIILRLPRSGPPGLDRPRGCDWPWTGAYVCYDGSVMPCCMLSTPDRMNFGSVAQRSFLEIWEGEDYRAFRGALASDEPPEVCASCALYNGHF